MKNRIRTKTLLFTLLFVVGIQGVLFGQEKKQSIEIFQLPCTESSYDGEDYYRAMGIGVALDGPESMIEARYWAVQGVLFRAFSEFYDAVKKSLGECVCIDTCRLPDGNYQTIVVYDVPMDALMLNAAEALASTQLKINRFYRKQYWKQQEPDEREFRERAIEFLEKANEDIKIK